MNNVGDGGPSVTLVGVVTVVATEATSVEPKVDSGSVAVADGGEGVVRGLTNSRVVAVTDAGATVGGSVTVKATVIGSVVGDCDCGVTTVSGSVVLMLVLKEESLVGGSPPETLAVPA